MKKIISLLIAVILVMSLAACGSGDSNVKTVDLSQIKTDMLTQLAIADAGDISADDLLDLYGIAAEDVKTCACYVTMGGVFPEEVVMVEATSSDALKRIEEKMNTRIESVKVQAQNYDAENYAIAQKSQVQKQGNYIAMFLSPNYDALVRIFNSNF